MSKLFLLPNLLGDFPHHEVFLPNSVDKAMGKIQGLIAESDGAGRRYLGRFKTIENPRQIPIALYNKHTKEEDIDFLLEPMRKGETWGFVTDAGLPCIADPGASLVSRARELGIGVQAFIGPCSFILALMLSGFSGQSFHFHGYLPKEEGKRLSMIKRMEKEAEEGTTQIFMEAPFRSQPLLEELVNHLMDSTLLATAWDLTLPTQGILSQTIERYKKSPLPQLEKRATVFLIAKNFT